MKALSDPNRARVLKLLQNGELCVCEIQNVLGLAQSTVSKHMKILEDAGLVNRKRQGTWILYNLADGSDSEYAQTVLTEIRHWLEDDKILKEMRKVLPQASVMLRRSAKR
jgi:ArsR family transcriptional regulator